MSILGNSDNSKHNKKQSIESPAKNKNERPLRYKSPSLEPKASHLSSF